MKTDSTIVDFSKYSDEQLEASLKIINRDKFEQNYLNCCAEIEKRKIEGVWNPNAADKSKKNSRNQSIKDIKVLRLFAIVQGVGALIGAIRYLVKYGPEILTGNIQLATSLIIIFISSVLFVLAFAAWKYLKTNHDWKGLWRTLLWLQIPAFTLGGFAYGFHAGFGVPLGLKDEQFGITADIGTDLTLLWTNQTTNLHFTVNLAAIAILVLLSRAEAQKSAG